MVKNHDRGTKMKCEEYETCYEYDPKRFQCRLGCYLYGCKSKDEIDQARIRLSLKRVARLSGRQSQSSDSPLTKFDAFEMSQREKGVDDHERN